jgi:hypothetical protein
VQKIGTPIRQLFCHHLAQRDIVFIDQRGAGYSQPALNCTVGTPPAGVFPFGAQSADRPEMVQLLVDTYIRHPSRRSRCS